MLFVVVAREQVDTQSTQDTLAREHAKHGRHEHVDKQDTLACQQVSTQGTLAHEHVSTQGTLARQHVSTKVTLTGEYVGTEDTLASEHVFSTQGTQFSRLGKRRLNSNNENHWLHVSEYKLLEYYSSNMDIQDF